MHWRNTCCVDHFSLWKGFIHLCESDNYFSAFLDRNSNKTAFSFREFCVLLFLYISNFSSRSADYIIGTVLNNVLKRMLVACNVNTAGIFLEQSLNSPGKFFVLRVNDVLDVAKIFPVQRIQRTNHWQGYV